MLSTGGKHLLDYWAVLVRRRWVLYLAVASVFLASLVGSFLVTPLYRATATLQIQRQNPDILTFRDLAKVDHSWAAYSDFYQTQYRIIASRSVARRAVKRLGLTEHPVFAGSGKPPGLLTRLKRTVVSWIPRRGERVQLDPVDIAAMRLKGSLEVSPVRNSHLVRLSWIGTEPQLAADVTNAVADAYIQYNIESQFSTTEQAGEFLINQIGKLKREIGASEALLREYGRSKRIISIDEASNITLQALKDIAEQRTRAQTALARAEAAFRAVERAPADALPEVLQSNLIMRLREEYAQYEAELSEKSRRFKSDWPGLQTLKSKLEKSRQRLELETARIASQVRARNESDHSRALSEVRNLEKLLKDQEDAAQRLKIDAVEYANRESDVEKKRETLNALMQRQNEMSLSAKLKTLDSAPINVRVMEHARAPGGPFRPNTKLNLLLGLLLGAALGVGMAFFLDYLDNTVNTPSDLARSLSAPILAVIPRQGDLKRLRRRQPIAAASSFDLITAEDMTSESSEAYRELRTAILLSHAGQPPRRIMITSALPDEGKSATTTNLAIVLAQLGQPVLVVDTDLRRPRLHKAFDLQNRRGVSTYLAGQEDDLRGLIVPTGIPNLSFLPSGPVPPNPSELLNSPRFVQLGRELLEQGFAHLVHDSPPALSVSDAVIMAAVVDSSILVVRANRTPRPSVRLAAERLEQACGSLTGVVLNDLEIDAPGSYRRYHYYGERPGRRPVSGDSQAGGTGS